MKTFKISISETTNKGKEVELKTKFVNSENSWAEVQVYFRKQYDLFNVTVSEIEVIELLEGEGFEQIIEKGKSISKIVQNRNEISASIFEEDIQEEWNKRKKSLEPLKEKIKTIEKNFEEEIKNKFNLKKIKDFKVDYERVSFKFYSSWFDFNKNKDVK